ncbi:hypothetical protein N0V88_000473 [Collariella sp. IMI 366227]|nr:hypothetical protein N0V88_000473 [Collariella sp. IMI 366227]
MNDSKESAQSLETKNEHKTPAAGDPSAPPPTELQTAASDDTAAEMPPGGRPRPNQVKREADFSSLLIPPERAELTALVTKLTESMQTQLTQLFDPVRPDAASQPSRVSFWSQLPYRLKDLSLTNPLTDRGNLKENAKPSRSRNAGRARDRRDAPPDAFSQNEANIAPRLQELKKEALQHFKKWQTMVHKRVGDISVRQPPGAPPGQSFASRRRTMSNNRRNRPGGRSKTAPDSDFAVDSSPGPAGFRTSATPVLTVETDPVLVRLYPPTATMLSTLPVEKRCLLLHCLILLLLSLENYSAYTRVLLLNITSSLHLPLRILLEEEVRVGCALSQVAKAIPPELLAPPKKTEDGKQPRRWKAGLVNLAGLGGGSGNLPPPLADAGIGSVFGTAGIPIPAAAGLLGSMNENGMVVGALFSVCGTRPGGKMMEHYLKEVGDFAFIPLRGSIGQPGEIGKSAFENRRLRLVVGVAGWLTSNSETVHPWQCLGEQNEVYAVRWELEALTKLSNSFDLLVRSAAWSMAKKEIVARPIFANMVDGRWPASLLKISKIVDNNWNNAMVRADKLGAALADVIMGKAQGERGVSLIGYSIGARAIYACLMCLAERRAFGLVENAVLMGTPAPSDPMAWCAMKSVVTGRLVNVYSENDYILGFLYRTSSIEFGLAGLQRVIGVEGIENVDVTAKISLHPRYQYLVGSILRHVGWEDTVQQRIARDEADMLFYEDRNRKHEERREAVELGGGLNGVLGVKKENGQQQQQQQQQQQGVIRTRMRKRGKK